MTQTYTFTQQYIMDNFDFGKMHDVMITLDWQWGMVSPSIPSLAQLKQTAVSLFDSVWAGLDSNQTYACSTGGFHCSGRLCEDGFKYISLKFVITDWDNSDQEYEHHSDPLIAGIAHKLKGLKP